MRFNRFLLGAAGLGLAVGVACSDDESSGGGSGGTGGLAGMGGETGGSETGGAESGGTGGETGGTAGMGAMGGMGGMGGMPPQCVAYGMAGMGGIDGGPAQSPELGDIVINELQALGDPDFVELYNTTDACIDLSGFYLLDADVDMMTPPLIIPNGTIIEPGGFFVIDLVEPPFSLNNALDELTLYAPDDTVLDSTTWPAGFADVSWARYPDGAGDVNDVLAFSSRETATPGEANDANEATIPE